jgi:hypothetical protein
VLVERPFNCYRIEGRHDDKQLHARYGLYDDVMDVCDGGIAPRIWIAFLPCINRSKSRMVSHPSDLRSSFLFLPPALFDQLAGLYDVG